MRNLEEISREAGSQELGELPVESVDFPEAQAAADSCVGPNAASPRLGRVRHLHVVGERFEAAIARFTEVAKPQRMNAQPAPQLPFGIVTLDTFGGRTGCKSCPTKGLSPRSNLTQARTSSDYTARGLLQNTLDSEGRLESYRYNSLGELIRLTETGADGGVRYTEWDYDIEGNLTAITDSNQRRTEFLYDGLGRLLQRKFDDGKNFTYTYDAADRLTAMTHSTDGAVAMVYDAESRPVLVAATGLDASVSRSYVYDALGGILQVDESVAGNTVTITRANSSTGEVLEETISGAGPSRTLQFAYLGGGQLSTVTYPDGDVLMRQHDPIGRLQSVTSSLNGLLVSYTGPYGLTRYTTAALGNGLSIEQDFGPAGKVVRRELRGTGLPLSGWTYQYDLVGNMDSRTRSADGLVETFDYDGFSRLTGWTWDAGGASEFSKNWSHDLADNIELVTTPVGQVETVQSNNLNQYTSFGTLWPQISYTGRGQEKQRIGSGGTMDWQWDALGRPLSVTITDSGGTENIGFQVDAFDRIVARASDADSPRYFSYHGILPVVSTDGGADWSQYAYGLGGEILFRSSDLGDAWYFQDVLGNVSARTDWAGSLLDEFAYAPYGRPLDPGGGQPLMTNLPGSEIMFSGALYDWRLRASYMGRRLYDVDMGRFLSRDPLGEQGGLNLYSYARSNPLRYRDPSGLKSQDAQPSAPVPPGLAPAAIGSIEGGVLDGLAQELTGDPDATYSGLSIQEKEQVVSTAIDRTRSALERSEKWLGVVRGAKKIADAIPGLLGDKLHARLAVSEEAIEQVVGLYGRSISKLEFTDRLLELAAAASALFDTLMDPVGTAVDEIARKTGNDDNPLVTGVKVAAGVAVTGAVLFRAGKTILAARGGARYSDDLVKAAQSKFPGKAGKIEQHHVTPKYLGGDPKGPTVPLDAAYHQQITNEFRKKVPYGSSNPDPAELERIKREVYKKFPLPGGG